MCEIDDGDVCQVFTERTRRARKPHRCEACGSAIAPGDRYRFNSFIFDGEPGSARLCLPCAEARDRFGEEHHYRPAADGFAEALRGCIEWDAASRRKWGPTLRALERRRDAAHSPSHRSQSP